MLLGFLLPKKDIKLSRILSFYIYLYILNPG
jgi:hypothetical protein